MSKYLSKHSPHHQTKVIEIKPIKIHQENSEKRMLYDPSTKNHVNDHIKRYKEELARLEKQKATLVQEIKEKIASEKKQWLNEREKFLKEARHEGYQEGLLLGKQEALAKYDSLIQEANDLIQQASKDYSRMLDQSQEKMIEIAMYTAEKILRQEISEDSEKFLPIIKAAIQEIKDQPRVSIYVHPNNYETVLQHQTGLLELLNGDTKLSIFIDQSLKENSCLIEHPYGQIDASIDTQLEQIHKALKQYLVEKNRP